jgi:nicotinamide mononucleotide transporter
MSEFVVFGQKIGWKDILEFLGLAASLIYLYYSVKVNKLLWIFGLLSAVFYTAVFFVSKVYAAMGLQTYYIVISVYGWILWNKSTNDDTTLKINRVSLPKALILIVITFVIFVPMSYFLKNYTDTNVPYWDSILTSASIVATWMLARKILEHWIIWVIVDIASMALYAYQDLKFTMFLFAVYTIFAVKGFIDWRKEFIQQGANEKL